MITRLLPAAVPSTLGFAVSAGLVAYVASVAVRAAWRTGKAITWQVTSRIRARAYAIRPPTYP